MLDVDGTHIPVTNLDKILYPDDGFTKAQVIDYYVRISPYLLPHLKDRPLTLKRYPDGVEGGHFYEKNAPKHTPRWVKTVQVPHTEREGSIRYILTNDLATLVWGANLANLELHTFLAHAPDLHCPDMVVFDLDPGLPAGVLECAQVALWLKEMLNGLGLRGYSKSSGSKGIQVYVPLNTPATYALTKDFARTVAIALEAQHPDLVTSNMSKNLRKGRVFIDWSQNSEHKTTICVYSLRAAHGLPFVSIPFEWQEMERLLRKGDRDGFYVEADAAVKRTEKLGDLFQPLLVDKQKIPSDYQERVAKLKPSRKGDTSIRSYRAKRDFSQTQEPPPSKKTPKTRQKDPIFVIQKHDASHLHYDFRLEMEGVLRSWAVPRGLPTTLKDKKLAMHVEDHPMEYLRFEGTIPKGNYGAGTVMVWDIGTYEVKQGEDPGTAYRKGRIALRLHGKKLQGEWVLFRSKIQQGDKEGWLVMKTDASIPPIGPRKDDTSVLTGRSMKKIAADNDAQWISRPKGARG